MDKHTQEQVRLHQELEEQFVLVLQPLLAEMSRESIRAAELGQVAAPIPQPLITSFLNTMARLWAASIRGAAEALSAAHPEGFTSIKGTPDYLELILSRFVTQYGRTQSEQILATTSEQIRNLVLGGLTQGQAQEAVFAQILDNVEGTATLRATIITRTEVHSAMQFASNELAKLSQVRLRKTWVAVIDDRTRGNFTRRDEFNHRAMQGQSVPLDSPFLVPRRNGTLEPLAFPGDPSGSAGNIINCRCVQIYEREY
jgi:hypothetical protein